MRKNLRQQFGERLKQIRQQKRMTQEEFAELVGVSIDFLSLIERGINAPSFEKLEAMVQSLNLSVETLFTFAGGHKARPAARSGD
jgi:transcriptional regulator with XRE-family HTH domain